MSLIKRFYADRYLNIRSFSIQLALISALCAVFYSMHAPGFYDFHFAWWHLSLVPLGVYAGGVSAVFIHNATHHSFRWMWLNELCGYLAGLHQLWGYLGWKLIHLVHHQYSDHPDMDPHPPLDRSFWQFAKVMFLESSRQISGRYLEHWGDNATTRRLQLVTTLLMPVTAFTTLACWYLLLGPAGFLFFYIPSYVANHLLFVDVNYTAHPKDPDTGETKAANLNHRLYYKIANFFWFGIYFHGNHHRRPMLFNPRYMQAQPPREAKAEMHLAA